MDELSPLFHDIEFNERFRGYDVEEVDAYVDRVAKAAALVQGRIAELQDRVAAAEAQPRSVAASAADTGDVDDARLSRVLVLAQRTADAAIEEAKAEADAMRLEAAADAEAARREADDHVSLVLAEAETDRRRLLAEAQESAAAAVAEAHQRGAQELARLETRRTELADEITLLECHMAETRLAVAASVSALTDLLDSPDAFRAPTVTPVPSPAPGEPTAATGPGSEPAHAADEPTESDEGHRVDAITSAEDSPAEETPAGEMLADEALADEAPADDVPGETLADEMLAGETLLFDPSWSTDDVDIDLGEAGDESADLANSIDPEEPVDHADSVDLTESVDGADTEPAPMLDLTDADAVTAPAAEMWQPSEPSGPSRPDRSSGGAMLAEQSEVTDVPSPAPPLLVTAADIETPDSGATAPDPESAAPMQHAQPKTEEFLFVPEDSTAGDDFLDQLRDAVQVDEGDDFGEDALAAFFDAGDDKQDKSWFNRRR